MNPPTNEPSLDELRAAGRQLRDRFERFARQVRARLLLREGAKWLALVAGLALATFVLDRTLRLSVTTRRGMLVVALAVVVVQAWRWLLAPLRLALDLDVLAAALERSVGNSLAARAATVLQLPAADRGAASEAMVARAVARSNESLAAVDFESRLDPRRRQSALRAIVATVVVSLGLALASPSSARLWAKRLFAGSNQPWPQRTLLQVAGLADDGVLTVPRGEGFVLRVSARPGTVSPDAVSVRWRQPGSSAVDVQLARFGPNDFRYDFPAVQSDASVELAGGDDVVGPITVRPVDRPRIVNLQLTSRHPRDNAPRTHNFSGDDAGDLSFLPYTKLELTFTANAPVADVHLTSSAATPGPDSVRRLNDRQFAVAWGHAAATQLQIEMTGAEARLNSAPTNVSIGLKSDKPPRTSLGFTGVRQRVTPASTIPLVAEARDDYQVDRLELRVKSDIPESEGSTTLRTSATTRPLFGPATRPDDPREAEIRRELALNVAELKLQPGHLLTLTAVAIDTCYPQPQSAASRQVVFHVVRPEDLFKEILVRQQTERARLRKQDQEAKLIRQDLESPGSSEGVAQFGRRHRAVQREVARIRTTLADSLTEMRLNVLGNGDAYALMESGVLGPLKALDAELMNPQRDALDALRVDDATALAAARDRQDQIINRIEDVLRQMAQWDSFIDVLNQLNEVIRLENQVQQGTTILKKKQVDDVFDH